MNEKQQQAILLLATGKTGMQVAEQLQITPKTVSTWRADPEFRAALNRYLLDIRTAHSEHLSSLCTTALQTIEDCLNSEALSIKDKLTASIKVLQLGHVSPSKIGSTDPKEIKLDEELKL